MALNKLVTQNKYTPLAATTSSVGRSTSTPLLDQQTDIIRTSNYDSAGRLDTRAAVEALNLDLSNPPFDTSTGRGSNPNVPGFLGSMVSRGFIRRADPTSTSDPTGKYRLRFMYNPEAIQRSYISYLDQQALDPFNTINGSANKAAAPGILDFSFELFFDRQVENAQDASHPGALVDFAYFDLVVRGVVPTSGRDIPDNGIMMVNPRDIVIVFSDEFTVRGRPYNARVSYEKFAHDMTPTRIRITLMVKAMYVGPQAPVLETPSTNEKLYSSTVPYESSKVNISYYTPKSDDAGVQAMIKASGYEVETAQPGGGSGGSTGGAVSGSPIAVGGSNAETIWKFLRSKGLAPHQAAGVMGNMYAEAHFEPRQMEIAYSSAPHLSDDVPPSVNSVGQPGFGICQWTSPNRKQGLRDMAASLGKKAGTLDAQLPFLWHELNTSYKRSVLEPLLASSNVRDATKVFLQKFEVPAGAYSESLVNKRTGYSMNVLKNSWAV